jgi:hypothetical protein
MKKTSTLLLLSSITLIAGCSTSKPVEKKDKMDDALIIAASNISNEMTKIIEINRGRERGKFADFDEALNKRITINMDAGSIETFADELRRVKLVDIKEVGIKPLAELPLSLHYKQETLLNIMKDVGMQLGSMADVIIANQSITIRYNRPAIE